MNDKDNNLMIAVELSKRRKPSIKRSTRTSGFIGQACMQYSLDEFKSHFRITHCTAEAVILSFH